MGAVLKAVGENWAMAVCVVILLGTVLYATLVAT
jgi:hypothetical protein